MKRLLFSALLFVAGSAQANVECPAGSHTRLSCNIPFEQLTVKVCEAAGQMVFVSSSSTLKGFVESTQRVGRFEKTRLQTNGGIIDFLTEIVNPGTRSNMMPSRAVIGSTQRHANCIVDNRKPSLGVDVFPGQAGAGYSAPKGSMLAEPATRFPR